MFERVAVSGLTDRQRTEFQERSIVIPAIPVFRDRSRYATFGEGMVMDGVNDELTVNFGGE